MEYIAFHSVADIHAAARGDCERQVVLPSGTHAEKELFHGVSRQHARVAAIQGEYIAWFAQWCMISVNNIFPAVGLCQTA